MEAAWWTKPEEGGDDVKSSWPLWVLGFSTRIHNGREPRGVPPNPRRGEPIPDETGDA